MAQTIRKQVYLSLDEDEALLRLARASHSSQAEVIRQALRQYLEQGGAWRTARDWEEALAFMEALAGQGPLESRPRSWTREDLYEDRPVCRERRGSD